VIKLLKLEVREYTNSRYPKYYWFPSSDWGGLGYRLTGHAYQESDQKKSTMDMTVDEEKKERA
jgi:hypothetical protein